MLKVHNFWTLAAAVLVVIIIANFLTAGTTTLGLAKSFTTFGVNSIKALRISPQGGNSGA